MELWNRRTTRLAATAAVVCALGLHCTPASATSILFVGNSFTYGDAAGGPNLVMPFGAGTVTDLNGSNIGGVPALFKAFTMEKGLSYNVSLETHPGVGLDWHYNNKLAQITQPWDKVVLQSYSTLDGAHPGNPATLIQYSALLADALHAQNPAVKIYLDATWSRADQTYLPSGHWYGQPIDAMEKDVEAGYRAAKANSPLINGDVITTGAAWNRAIENGFADPNPYNGITPGQVDLWAPEGYHASVFGYYLEALMMFGDITGLDPRTLGGSEFAALALGITSAQAITLQEIAFEQLAASVPEPSSLALLLVASLSLIYVRRRGVQVL
ncbi:MAG: glycosyl transferase family 1 [Rhodospirillales bacterium]|nr:glycosyl transferase family 1 [Rhodospirillales bacterium]